MGSKNPKGPGSEKAPSEKGSPAKPPTSPWRRVRENVEAVIIAIIGFCAYHWRAYRVHLAQSHGFEAMVLTSLRGSAFAAILLSAGAALQSVQILCVYLLGADYALDAEFGSRLAAVVAMVILTGAFCIAFWLLKLVRPAPST